MKRSTRKRMWPRRILSFFLTAFLVLSVCSADPARPPKKIGIFPIEVRKRISREDGLPDARVHALAMTPKGVLYAGTSKGLFRSVKDRWEAVASASGSEVSLVTAGGEEVWYLARGAVHLLKGDTVSRLGTLPVGNARRLAVSTDGQTVFLAMEEGLFRWQGTTWHTEEVSLPCSKGFGKIRDAVIGLQGELAIAAESGLYLRAVDGHRQRLLPGQGNRNWAPTDVRAVAYDTRGRLWFASPQGVGVFDGRSWELFTGREGLPYNDFTVLTPGEDGVVWLGTRRGAIRFDGVDWEYRQGQRWIPGDEIFSLAVDPRGNCWLATDKGISCIERQPISLRQKADFYEKEIDLRHRRTPYGYVLGVSLPKPGDKSNWLQQDSDNDGLWTAMYGAGECYAFAATGEEIYRRKAKAAFDALRFLGQVTQGGSPSAPPGYVARTILPAGAGDPNKTAYTREKDQRFRATRDRLWKIMSPRWPLSANGQWYWKSDTSSDELDGHYFFYARYFDLVAGDGGERKAVQDHVRALTDHLLRYNYTLTDWDGKPTRWAIFRPESLNDDPAWWEERGLNSLSILSYLVTATHITGDEKYRLAAKQLIEKYGYAANTLIAKNNAGPGAGNQSDDEMAFLCYYNLLLYEKDPVLIQRFALGFYRRWLMEKNELCPLFHFLAAAVLEGKIYSGSYGTEVLSPTGDWLEESIDTLKRFPLELIDWRMSNSHRTDLVMLPDYAGDGEGSLGRGARYNGKVLKVDERFVDHWNHDPWRLDQGGNGHYLADGAGFLLPYYMGLYHRWMED